MTRTNKEIKMNVFGYDIVIPKGTKTTHNTAMGYDESYNFIDDFSWIRKDQGGLLHDATYYGINIPKKYVEEV